MAETDKGDYAAAIQAAETYWNDRASRSGSDTERVEWSRRGQLMRFEVFCKTHDLRGKSLLDVGCGAGELLAHLRRLGSDCEYTGFDLSPAMVARCRERFPEASFHSGDFLTWQAQRSFDFVVSIGIHNIRIPQGAQLLRASMHRQFEMATEAAYLSLLTDRYPGFDPHIQPWRAEEVLGLALQITPNVTLRHDYLPNDFSVALYRRPMIDARSDLLLD